MSNTLGYGEQLALKKGDDLLQFSSLDELPSALFEVMSDGVIITNEKSIITCCNPAFYQRLGYEKDEVIGLSIMELDAPGFAERLSERVAEIEQYGRLTFETAHRRKDGSIMPVEISAHVCEIDGETAFFGIVRDISARKATDKALKKQQELLARAEQIAHIGSWELDLSTNQLQWSDEIFRIFELDPETTAPSYELFLDAIHPDDRELVDSAFNESVESRQAYDITHRLQMPDGRIKWVHEQGVTIYKAEQAVRSYGTVQDITNRKQAEDALRENEAKLRSLIETLPDLVFLKDPKGRYLACNHRFEEFFGAREADIVGKTDYDFVERDQADFFREKDMLAVRRGCASRNEEEITFASDGHTELVEAIKTPVYGPQGELLGVLGVARDITGRKQFEAKLKEGLDVYRAAINTPVMGFWAADARGNLVEVNDSYAKQSRYTRDELLHLHINDLDAQESEEQTKARIAEIKQKGYTRFRTTHRRKDGSVWPVEVITSFSHVQGGRFFVFIEDLTERVRQEQDLELAANVLETISQAVVITDSSNSIVSINPATTEITGYTLDELKGKDPKVFSSGRHDRAFYSQMWQALEKEDHWEGEIWDRRKDGSVHPKWTSINVIRDAEGNVVQYVSVFSDITERKRTEEIIWRQANFDALTGLANRTLFQKQLEHELARRGRSLEPLAIVYLDLDGFKDVNDTLGHAAGDMLLEEVAKRIKKRARSGELVARVGGDEFTLLITDIHKPEQVGTLAQDILVLLHESIHVAEREIHISASIGIALYPDDGHSGGELIKNADVAMYQAKARGKNNFQFFRPEMNMVAFNRLSMIHDLHRAVEKNNFLLYYQPKIRFSDGKVIGAEALIRWPRDGGGMVPPDLFIPCAEETGLIIPLGGWVLEEACQKLSEWNRHFDTNLSIAVNLSARQFRNSSLVEDVLASLREHDISPHLLELEITEGILMEDVEEAISVMARLRDAGIDIAIDDFGTGYSSLNYLKRFPITTLKVDRSFINELTVDSHDAAIVRSTIGLAGSLGLKVVAEGVENTEQYEFLQEHRCDFGQGYYIGRPMPAEQFEEFLRSHGNALT